MTDNKLDIILSANSHDEFTGIRSLAFDAWKRCDLPITKNEEWLYTSLRGLWNHTFKTTVKAGNISNNFVRKLPEALNHRLVFVDGHFSPAHSVINHLPDGVEVIPFSQLDSNLTAIVKEYFNKIQNFESEYFTLLNTSGFTDGAFVFVPENLKLDETIHLVYISSKECEGKLILPRTLIVGKKLSEFKIVEEYISESEDFYLSVPVTEVLLADGAHLSHIRIQNEGRSAYHVNRIVSELHRNSDLQSYTISLGSRLFRNDVRGILKGDAGHATIDGLVLVNENQLSDTHSVMDHATPNCTSHQLHKCIVDGVGTSVFNGKIFVRKDAQQTNAFQENHNMQLSNHGMVYTKPQLEIFADDVKCSHGATVGQLNEEQKFYLESRGLNEIETKELLTFGFAVEVIDSIPVASVRDELRAAVKEFTQKSFEAHLIV